MSEKLIQDTTLTNIANAIRGKDGTSASIQVSDFADRIEAIPTGSGDYNGDHFFELIYGEITSE